MIVEGLGWRSKFIYLMKMSKGFVVLARRRRVAGVPGGVTPKARGPVPRAAAVPLAMFEDSNRIVSDPGRRGPRSCSARTPTFPSQMK